MLFNQKDDSWWETLKGLMLMKAAAGGALTEYTVTGNPVSFNTNVSKPLRQMLIPFAPVQDLHGYDAPYPAGGGKNKFNVFALESVTGMTVNSNGTLTMTAGAVRSGKTLAQIAPGLVVGQTYKLLITTTGTLNKYIHFRDASVSWNYGADKELTQAMFDSEVNFYGEGNQTVTLSNLMIVSATETSTDYSPYSNICPISGFTGVNVSRTGINLFDKSTLTDGYIIVPARILNGEIVNPTSSPSYCYSKLIPVKPSTKYYMSGYSGSGIYTVSGADINGNGIISWYGGASKSDAFVFTTPSNCYYVVLVIPLTQKDTTILAESEYAIPYEPYIGTTIPITFPAEAGTVYGGTLDLTTGVLTVDRAEYVFSGNESWTASQTAHRFSLNLKNIISIATQPMTTDALQNVFSSVYGQCIYKNADHVPYVVYQLSGSLLVINEPNATTTAEISAIFAETQLVYELATPLEFQLTPQQVQTLIGDNVIFSDTNGENTVKYLKKG